MFQPAHSPRLTPSLCTASTASRSSASDHHQRWFLACHSSSGHVGVVSKSCIELTCGRQLIWMSVSSYIYLLAANSNLLAAGEFNWSFASVFSALSESS